jgi:hypothetical protein
MFRAVGSLFRRGARRLLREALEEAAGGLDVAEARELILEAFSEALATMEGMLGNAGQEAVFISYVVPQFSESLAASSINDGWLEVDIGEYMDFMGEIVGEGNSIMEDAYEEAADLLSEIEELAFEGIGRGEFAREAREERRDARGE